MSADQSPVSHQQFLSSSFWTRRRLMRGAALLGAATPLIANYSNPVTAGVPDFRRPGDRDDTAAAVRAMEAGDTLYFPAGRGLGAGGAYALQPLSLRSNVTLFGDGVGSVLTSADAAAKSVIVAMSASVNDPLKNIALRDLRIEGLVTRTGFREHWNLVALSGVSGVRIDRVDFVGFAGDGLYLGAEREGTVREPRIVHDVVIRDCLFDGVNNDNRNGISVTGGSDITIDRCRFRRCSRPNMPGPIDFEPDAYPFYRLERLRVTGCDFDCCGGGVGQVAVVIPAIVAVPRGIWIADNRFRNYRGTGGDVSIMINRQPNAATPAMDVAIEDNVGTDGYSGFQIFSGKGVVIRRNRWTRYAGPSFIGFIDARAGAIDVQLSDHFDYCGWRFGTALAIYKGEDIRLDDNSFVRSGHGRPGSAPIYIGTGRIRRLALRRNDFRNNPASLGLIAVERGADYLEGTGDIAGNIISEGRALPAL